ncbi:hypothetical protein O6P43_013812 [Quillaja saponaria]|uniref:Uncharacterized protein n=1 Tax=Quillaja saponaria TaxID=32244 RepID=A0AAD7PR09_QUISA|nr:hypothetical protein O6P43_013812 [Quillaja saponaria]
MGWMVDLVKGKRAATGPLLGNQSKGLKKKKRVVMEANKVDGRDVAVENKAIYILAASTLGVDPSRHTLLQKPGAIHYCNFLRYLRFTNLQGKSNMDKMMSVIVKGNGLVVFWEGKIVSQR